MSIERVNTLIVGAGQAGLAMSHMLSDRNHKHLVVERGRIGERWRTERWDGLRFQFPNWSVQLPNFTFRAADPDAFATVSEIVAFITQYANFIAAPIRSGVTVTKLQTTSGASRFIVQTSSGPIAANHVVVATGPFQRPYIPNLLPPELDLFQIHASSYKNPDQLPAGAVLIIGSGASGAQIAEELLRADRQVFLSVGRHRRMPRRYRGKDLIWWLSALGLDQTPVEKRGPDKTLPLITGAYGGHTIDFCDFVADGVTLLGRVVGAQDHVVKIAPDLLTSLAQGDAAYTAFLDLVDNYVERHGLALPDELTTRPASRKPRCLKSPLSRLNLRDGNVRSVIWATGYQYDFGWIDLPIFNPSGEPVHRKGVTDIPGLYFLGLPWLSKMNSSFMAGVGDDAARLADEIVLNSSDAVLLAP